MISVPELRTRAFVAGALSPAFDAIIDRTYLELLWAVRVVESHLRFRGPGGFAEAIAKLPEGGARTCLDISFLLDDLRLYDAGVHLGYFSAGADVELSNPLKERIRIEETGDPYWLLHQLLSNRGESRLVTALRPTMRFDHLSIEQFEDILPSTRELRTRAMRDCVRNLFFVGDDEWQLALAQVDWLIDALTRNFVPTLSTDQLDSLSWSMSGSDEYLEVKQQYPLVLDTVVGVHVDRWRELLPRRGLLSRLGDVLARQSTFSIESSQPAISIAPEQRVDDMQDWPTRQDRPTN